MQGFSCAYVRWWRDAIQAYCHEFATTEDIVRVFDATCRRIRHWGSPEHYHHSQRPLIEMHTKHRSLKPGLLLLVLSVVASAADITGNWKADLQTPQGKVQVSYSFKQEGETLTGTWQAAQSPTVQISEGKVVGDKVSFVVKVGPSGGPVFAHEGRIDGDEIQLTLRGHPKPAIGGHFKTGQR
jgi:hypothetical protein